MLERAAGSIIIVPVFVAKTGRRVTDKPLPDTGLDREWLIRRNTKSRPTAPDVRRVLNAKSLGDIVGVSALVRDEIVVLQKLEKGMNVRSLQPHKLSQIAGVQRISLMVQDVLVEPPSWIPLSPANVFPQRHTHSYHEIAQQKLSRP